MSTTYAVFRRSGRPLSSTLLYFVCYFLSLVDYSTLLTPLVGFVSFTVFVSESPPSLVLCTFSLLSLLHPTRTSSDIPDDEKVPRNVTLLDLFSETCPFLSVLWFFEVTRGFIGTSLQSPRPTYTRTPPTTVSLSRNVSCPRARRR